MENWNINSIEIADYENHAIISDKEVICHLVNNGNQKSNAKLIAKAPEMLCLLRKMVDENMLSHAGDELAKQLINEATCPLTSSNRA